MIFMGGESVNRFYKKVIILTVIVGILLFVCTFFVEELTVRRQIFVMGHPIAFITADIKKSNTIDPKYGQLFVVEGVMERATGGVISIFYVKKNKVGMFYVSSAGSGP